MDESLLDEKVKSPWRYVMGLGNYRWGTLDRTKIIQQRLKRRVPFGDNSPLILHISSHLDINRQCVQIYLHSCILKIENVSLERHGQIVKNKAVSLSFPEKICLHSWVIKIILLSRENGQILLAASL